MMAIEPIVNNRSMFMTWRGLMGDSSSAVEICRSWLEHVEGTLSDGILALVARFAPSRCTIRHDRVYAILGLASDASSCVVDYTLPLTEVVLRLVSTSACELDQLIGFYRAIGVSDSAFMGMLQPQDAKEMCLESTSQSNSTQQLTLDNVLRITLKCTWTYDPTICLEFHELHMCNCVSCNRMFQICPPKANIRRSNVMCFQPTRRMPVLLVFGAGTPVSPTNYIGSVIPDRKLIYLDDQMLDQDSEALRTFTIAQLQAALYHCYEDVCYGTQYEHKLSSE